jgi:transposase
MTQPAATQVTVGVDTHAEVHVAVANNNFGRRLDATSVPTTPAGYAELLGWAQGLGQIEAWGSRAPAASGLD